MIDLILVPVDGSAHANAAVDFASELAAKFGSKLILFNVISRLGSDHVPEGLQSYVELEHVHLTERDVLQSVANQIVANAEKRARAHGATKIETVATTGDPADSIVELAKKQNVSLITMGRRGLGGLKGLLLGSVSLKVSQLAECPCMTVP